MPADHNRNTGLIWAIRGVLLAAGIASFWGGLHSFSGDNANSRLATLYSLVHLDTWYLDTEGDDGESNPFEPLTIDKVNVGGRVLSSKPPVLPLMMTGVYWAVHTVSGKSLAEPDDRDFIVGLLILVFTTFPFVVSLYFMQRILDLLGVSSLHQLICLFAQAFCSGLWVYASTLNNHVPATACIVVALYGVMLVQRDDGGSLIRFAWIGLMGGLAIVTDFPAGALVFAMGLLLIPYITPKNGLALVLGGAIPLGVHSSILFALTGSILPVQLHPEWYLHESSYWRNPVGMDALNSSWWSYLFHFTFGRHGWFMTYPIMFIGLLGLIGTIAKGRNEYQRATWVALFGLVLIVVYYALKTNNYGGEAFGTRWLLITIPIFILGVAAVLSKCKKGWHYAAVSLLLFGSFLSAMHGHHAPWAADREWPVQILGTSLDSE